MVASVEDMTTLYARELMDKHGLQDWKLEWCDHMENASGRCFFAPKVIVLDRFDVLDTAARNIREIILHEIAHALVGPDVDSHGQEWWEKLLEIGGDGIWVTNKGRVTFAKPQAL